MVADFADHTETEPKILFCSDSIFKFEFYLVIPRTAIKVSAPRVMSKRKISRPWVKASQAVSSESVRFAMAEVTLAVTDKVVGFVVSVSKNCWKNLASQKVLNKDGILSLDHSFSRNVLKPKLTLTCHLSLKDWITDLIATPMT